MEEQKGEENDKEVVVLAEEAVKRIAELYQRQLEKDVAEGVSECKRKWHISSNWTWVLCLMAVAVVGCVVWVISGHVEAAWMLIDKISMFSMLLSIVLSAFAIQYTYTSNTQIGQQFERINDAAAKMKDAANRIQALSEQLSEEFNKLEEEIETIKANQDRNHKVVVDKLDNNKPPVNNDIKNEPPTADGAHA